MRLITLDENNKIVSVRNVGDDCIPQNRDLVSSKGECGQVMQSDGTFIWPEPESIEPQVSLDEQIYAENIYQTALLEMQQMLGGM